jgi:hypothetical protein
MTKDKFKNKNGSLTIYSFACGYIERFIHNNIQVDLYLDGCWHVRAHDFNKHQRLTWESVPTLTQARRYFSSIKQEVKQLV